VWANCPLMKQAINAVKQASRGERLDEDINIAF
jgi:hypothetical protein